MSSTISSKAILEYEAAIARIILVTVVEATPTVGRPPSRGFVAAALAGSLRRDLVAVDAHRLSTFGILARHGLDTLHGWINSLVDAGLLEVVQGRRGLVCSGEGRAVCDGTARPRPLGLLAGAVDGDRLDLAVRSGLVEALRRYRAERAAADETPEYRLFTEATLREIAARMPTNEKELEEIPALAERRLAAHGFELLRIVAEHLPIVQRLREAKPQPGDVMDEPLVAAVPW